MRTRDAGRPQRLDPPSVPSPPFGSNHTGATLETKMESCKLDTSSNERGENWPSRRPDRPRKYFQFWKGFLVVHTEFLGGAAPKNSDNLISGSHSSIRTPDSFSMAFSQKVFSKVRRFIVVRDNDKSCSALAITTHGGRGSMKSEHGIVYTGTATPSTEAPDDGISNLKREMRPAQVGFGPESSVTRMELKPLANHQRKWCNDLGTFARLSVPGLVHYGKSAGCLKPRLIQMYHSWDELQRKVASMSLTTNLGWTYKSVHDDDDEDETGKRRRVKQLVVYHPDSVKACAFLHNRNNDIFHRGQVFLEMGTVFKPSGEDPNNTHDSYGRTLLHMAAAGGHDKVVQMLLCCDSPDEVEDDVPTKHHVRWTQGYTRKLTKAAVLAMTMPCLRVLHNYGTSHGPLPTTRDSLGDLSLMVRSEFIQPR